MPKKKPEHAAGAHDAGKQEEFQAKYIQLQVLKQQLAAFIEEKNVIDEKYNEMNVTIDALHKMEDVTNGEEIWSSIGSGAFVRSDIKDIEKVLVAIGAGVVVRERRERAIEILQERLDQLTNLNHEIITEATKFSRAIHQLEKEVELLAHQQSA